MDAGTLRGTIFIVWLVVLLVSERINPRRPFTPLTGKRVLNNFALVVLNTVIVWIVLPWIAYDVAIWAKSQQLGLFHQLTIPVPIKFVLSIVLLDLVIYWQHRVFHTYSWLWSLHKVHHADTEFDTSTALRFHPIEIVLSMVIKMAVVCLLGIDPIAVIVFETLLNSSAMFNHANLYLKHTLDRTLRWVIVTPDMHRVHHSVFREECNANYGFFLSIWDKLFGSYVAQPKQGHNDMVIGLNQFRDPKEMAVHRMMSQPFRDK
ncbi:sterol desaturase [Vibrio sp. qd031]|uniref:sterol desaturase family protein n=1 Tax=Vibrio sp. qd031 TaxID=1603038 RepID=UPI000A0F6278|nr:sterol desaturase family protein [Vibrio sp. qd031]ORT49747.1 sterol desaturase [Vibrio sp. qd031]